MRSTTQGGGNIVDDSLVLYLDAANHRSYPGSGTRWYDLSLYKNDFTLTGTPTFTGGSFSFSGVGQYATCTNTTCGNFGSGSFTVEYIASVASTTAYYSTVIMKRGQLANIGREFNNGWAERVLAKVFYIQDSNPGVITPNESVHTNWLNTLPTGSTTYHICQTIERNGFDITGSTYINGAFDYTRKTTFIGDNTVNNTSAITLFRDPSTGTSTTGTLQVVRLYDRLLTATEVSQSYVALKPRLFGVL